MVTLNVAVNSYSNALLTLLINNQFVEIEDNTVEHFQLSVFVIIITVRNLMELSASPPLPFLAAMIKAAEIAYMPRIPCIAHGLYNSVKAAIKSSVEVQAQASRCHKLEKFFLSSPEIAQILQKEQEQQEPAAPSRFVIMDVVTSADNVAEDRLEKRQLKPTEWYQIEELVTILKAIHDMTLIFSSTSKGLMASIGLWTAGVEQRPDLLDSLSPEPQLFRDDLACRLEDRVRLTDIILVESVFHPSSNTL
ncbi:hypothetical protein BGZ99_002905 [Dissophora globulifera]|uniref:Uncharacterized protein n=1 Tax=Dissophora globulifera TaxID=979702 RepID=A0A9P6UVV7_9FUNG|nr:hypothetical protein BGZ99_002905 [Dissophora globulifera]